MPQRRLQSLILAIWTIGFIAQGVIYLTARSRRVEAYDVGRAWAVFRETCEQSLTAEQTRVVLQKLDGLRRDALVAEVRDARSFAAFVKERLAAVDFGDGARLATEQLEILTRSLVANAALNVLSEHRGWILQLYMPWFAAMLAALLVNATSANNMVSPSRTCIAALVAIGAQAMLGYLVYGYLLQGDIRGTADYRTEASAINSVVASLLLFVFPK
jgi:hypothetical protein